jgi:hypothetical protein
MVLLGVENEQHLSEWESKLYDYKFATFVEPDIGDQKTAIAVLPEDSRIFKELRLL